MPDGDRKEAAQATIEDERWWQELAPSLHLFSPRSVEAFRPFQIDSARAGRANGLLRQEGYFQLDPPAWDLPIATMAEAVARIRNLGLPPAFAFVYDEFWLVFAKLDGLIRSILGERYQLLPDFWAWYIDPAADEAGWKPHRDKGPMSLRSDGTAKSLTIWIPLTDATPLNSCMYMLPANRDPLYHVGGSEVRFDPPDIRALPAGAGSILCWNQAVLHWGSRSAKHAPAPRISIAAEFQRGDEPAFREPLLAPLSLPNFRTRLALIAKQILQYRHMYPLDPALEAVTLRLIGCASN